MKRLFLLALGLAAVLTSAGCFDLLSTPGVVMSPEGSQIYFLKPLPDSPLMSLASVSSSGGDATDITAPEPGTSVTAFAVNPISGELLYVNLDREGAQVMKYAAGSAQVFLPYGTFDGLAMGTLMRFSPDGSRIGLALLLLPPDVTPEVLGSLATVQPEALKGTRYVLYLVDAADGTLTAVSDPDTERVNSFAWSPDSTQLAYTTWVDGNGDGTIATVPNIDTATLATDPGDRTQIRLYDLKTGQTTSIDSQRMDYAPVFLSDTRLAYASVDVTGLLLGSDQYIMTYDLIDHAAQVAYTTPALVTGIDLSPDGQQVAWAESSAAQPTSDQTPDSHIYVAGTDFQQPRSVATLAGSAGLPDAPVWTPDGHSLILTSSSILSTLMKQTAASSSLAGSGAVPERITQVDVASGTNTTLYEGAISSSNVFTTAFSLVTSGAMQQIRQLSAP